MDPVVWGPPLWDLLFSVAFHHPEGCDDALYDLFTSLMFTLPCKDCQKSYAKILTRKAPLQRECRKDEYHAKWLWSVKDMVNQKLHKAYVGYSDVRKRYTMFRTLTNESAAIRLVKIMYDNADDDCKVHVATFAYNLSIVSVKLFDSACCEQLRLLRSSNITSENIARLVRWIDE